MKEFQVEEVLGIQQIQEGSLNDCLMTSAAMEWSRTFRGTTLPELQLG
jgi:hypothetical protein